MEYIIGRTCTVFGDVDVGVGVLLYVAVVFCICGASVR